LGGGFFKRTIYLIERTKKDLQGIPKAYIQ
jgi:hypothetical protein